MDPTPWPKLAESLLTICTCGKLKAHRSASALTLEVLGEKSNIYSAAVRVFLGESWWWPKSIKLELARETPCANVANANGFPPKRARACPDNNSDRRLSFWIVRFCSQLGLTRCLQGLEFIGSITFEAVQSNRIARFLNVSILLMEKNKTWLDVSSCWQMLEERLAWAWNTSEDCRN